jgi:hypothetical protein
MRQLSGAQHAFPDLLMTAYVIHQVVALCKPSYDGLLHVMAVLIMGLGMMGYFDKCPSHVARLIMTIAAQVVVYLVVFLIVTTGDFPTVAIGVDVMGIMIIDQVIDVLNVWDASPTK